MRRSLSTELGKYSDKLVNKPRWLYFNKIDLVLEDELEEIKTKSDLCDRMGMARYISICCVQNAYRSAVSDIQAYLDQLPKEAPKEQLLDPVQFKWTTIMPMR